MAVPGDYRAFVRSEARGQPLPDATLINAHFLCYGLVHDVYKPSDKPDMCYVTFGDPAELMHAIEEQAQVVGGVPCNVQQAAPRSAPPQAGGAGPPKLGRLPAGQGVQDSLRVYVTGLSEGLNEEVLKTYFTHFGICRDVYIPLDKVTGFRKPFAFVTMTAPEEVAAILSSPSHTIGASHIGEGTAINVLPAEARSAGGAGVPAVCAGGCPSALPTTLLGGSPLTPAMGSSAPTMGGHTLLSLQGIPTLSPQVSALADQQAMAGWPAKLGGKGVAHSPGSVKQGVPGVHRVFVFGMPDGLNADMLRGHFARHGEILDIYIPPNSPSHAFVTFSNQFEVQDALMHSGVRIAGFQVQGVKLAEPRRTDAARGRANPY